MAGPIVAFTNLPYVPDAGASCGAGTVNSPGTLDGATEAASHEYAETMTDQFPESRPPGGWTDHSGQENGRPVRLRVDRAAGAMFNLILTTGTVTVQGTWSNRAAHLLPTARPNFVYPPSITSFSPASGRRRLLGDGHRDQPGRRHRGLLRRDPGGSSPPTPRPRSR